MVKMCPDCNDLDTPNHDCVFTPQIREFMDSVLGHKETYDLKQYQINCLKRLKPMGYDKRLMYLSSKLCEESAEVMSPIVKNVIHGKELLAETVLDELGDLLFYMSALGAQFDLTIEDIAEHNDNKLKKRHGDSYNESYYKK